MKCNKCGQSYTRLDETCRWKAVCNLLGTARDIGQCKLEGKCSEDTACNDQDEPEWDCDLGQENRYCKHYQAES